MKITNQQQQQQQQHPAPITLNGMDLKEVTSFTYLASIVSTTGGTDEDVRLRIGKARNTFINLKPIWKSSSLSINNKIRIFNTNVKLVLLYGSETWPVCHKEYFQQPVADLYQQLSSFYTEDQMAGKNHQQETMEQTKQEPIAKQICRRKWRWIGHSLRRPLGDIARQASARVEPEREAASGTSKGDMEEIVCRGAETVLTYMDAGEKYSRRQKEVGDLQLKPYVPLGTQGSINNNNNH
ncbi:unnamed protein product [Trichobilharzia szidati]|nr:unnamed protein product [Trichobilharzia szidati]